MTMYYFAPDGSYGEADDLIIVDDKYLQQADWDTIENGSDEDRYEEVSNAVGSIMPTRVSAYIKIDGQY